MAENKNLAIVDNREIQNMIYTFRGRQVMTDREYFRFQLTEEEYENLRSQFMTSSEDNARGGSRYIDNVEVDDLDSQTFNDLVILLRDILKEKYPKTKLKRTMKSIHYANGFEDLSLKQSAF